MATPKILIVDDEPFNVDYLEQELEVLDCRTSAAVNGRDALLKVQAEMPDLILLDIMMPIMDGFEVLAHLRADRATRDIPVIIISANNDLRSVVKGIALGAEDYLPKPFEPAILHARVSSGLERKRLRDLEQLYLKGLERELDIASKIQMGFLPTTLPEVPGWELAAYFKAAREVAGDFYDAFLLPDGNLACVVGDVCDKGVGAALFMTLFRSLIRAASTTGDFCGGREVGILAPDARLRHVVSFTNNYIAQTHADANMFATLFMGIINVQDGMLSYINCGNEPPLVVREGLVACALRPTGPVVGVIPDAQFSVGTVEMARNDLLLAFTDGIPDSKNLDDEFFGSARLLAALSPRNATPAALLAHIEAKWHDFIGPADQFDDITLLAVKHVG